MCRSIVSLRDHGRRASPDEVTAAARQFVRKISGTKAKTPSRANQEAFDRAIDEIAHAAAQLLDDWQTPSSASSRRLNGASPSSSA
jgi:hypothetical protein